MGYSPLPNGEPLDVVFVSIYNSYVPCLSLMPAKTKIRPDEPVLNADSEISNLEAEAAIRNLIERFGIDPSKLQDNSSGLSCRCHCLRI
jgi:hypothetical protein